jgi:predicted dithiol-disulfide oxidoreductase (DUF899 family)
MLTHEVAMRNHPIVSQNEWLDARARLLAKEKAFTRWRDQLSEERRALPWVKVEKEYVFDGANGRETLSQLFQGSPVADLSLYVRDGLERRLQELLVLGRQL